MKRSGKRPLRLKWIDTDKGGGNLRSRLVCTEVRKPGTEAIFAPTPPHAAFRLLCSSAVTRRRDGGVRKIYIIDIKRAFFHANTRKPVYVKPPHLRGTKRCWKCKKAMYGTLSAAGEFQEELRDAMETAAGMACAASAPTMFYDAINDVMACGDGKRMARALSLDEVSRVLLIIVSKVLPKYRTSEVQAHGQG